MEFFLFISLVLSVVLCIMHTSLSDDYNKYKKQTSQDIISLWEKIYKLQEIIKQPEAIPEVILKEQPPEEIQETEVCQTKPKILDIENITTTENAVKEKEEKNTETENLYSELIKNNFKENKTDNNHQEELNLEKLFLGNIFIKMGVIALIFAFVMFIKYLSQYITFTPSMKIVAGYIIAFITTIISIHLHKKENMKKYSEALLGMGFAISFITTYASCTLYDVISTPTATVIGILLIILTFIFAQYCKTFSTAIIGLIGGYINPFVIDSSMSTNFLFGYLTLLNAISIVYIIAHSDKMILNTINLILTTLTVTIFSFFKQDNTVFLYPFMLWLLYFLNDIYFLFKDRYTYSLEILNRCNFLSLVWFINYIFKFEDKLSIGCIIMLYGAFYLIVASLGHKNKIYRDLHISNGLLALLTAVWVVPEPITKTCLWSVEGLLCAILHYYYNIKYSSNIKDLEKFIVAFFGFSVVSVFVNLNVALESNFAIILFAVPMICEFLSGKIIKIKNKNITDILNLSSLTLLFTYLSTLINRADITETNVKVFAYILIGLLYSCSSKVLLAKKFEQLAYSVYAISIIALFISNFVVETSWMPFINFGLIVNTLAILIGCYFAKNNKENADYFNLISLTLGFAFITSQFAHSEIDGSVMTFIYIVIGLLYSCSSKVLLAKKFEQLAYSVYTISIIALFISNFVVETSWMPIFNIELSANITAITISYYFAKKQNEYCNIFKYIALTIGLLLVFSEFRTIVNYFNFEISDIIYSSILIVYCAFLMITGIFRNIDYMKRFGICTTLALIIKIIFFDLADIEPIFKLIAFIVIGVCLLIVSYFYQKQK